MTGTLYVLIGIVVAIIAGFATPLITKKADTPIEQAAEVFIYKQTGKEIDFSASLKAPKPDTVEKEIVE